MPPALGIECCRCSSVLNGLVFEYPEGYVGYACCISVGYQVKGGPRRSIRIDSALLTEEHLTERQLLAALQSSTSMKSHSYEVNIEEKLPYFTLRTHKYKKL
jgi:hypothetical protein